jgi:hypothetical protein
MARGAVVLRTQYTMRSTPPLSNKFFSCRFAGFGGTVPAVPSLRPAVSNRANFWPEMTTECRLGSEVHPSASLDVFATCFCAITLMIALFPEPVSPHMTTIFSCRCVVSISLLFGDMSQEVEHVLHVGSMTRACQAIAHSRRPEKWTRLAVTIRPWIDLIPH